MSKTKPKAKKPPAHEVILARLQQAQRKIRALDNQRIAAGFNLQHDEATRCTHEIRNARIACAVLLDVLEQMHLPEHEEPKILAALRRLKADVIGTHRAHVRLLKCLSGHSPAHAMGAQPKCRRA